MLAPDALDAALAAMRRRANAAPPGNDANIL